MSRGQRGPLPRKITGLPAKEICDDSKLTPGLVSMRHAAGRGEWESKLEEEEKGEGCWKHLGFLGS